jgi:hypothetical protein
VGHRVLPRYVPFPQFLRSRAKLVSSSFRLQRRPRYPHGTAAYIAPTDVLLYSLHLFLSLSYSHSVDGGPDQHSLSLLAATAHRCVHNVQVIARALVADPKSDFANRLILERMKASNVHGNTMRQHSNNF